MFSESGAPANDSQSGVAFGPAMMARGFSSPGVTTNVNSSDQSGAMADGLIPSGAQAVNPNADFFHNSHWPRPNQAMAANAYHEV